MLTTTYDKLAKSLLGISLSPEKCQGKYFMVIHSPYEVQCVKEPFEMASILFFTEDAKKDWGHISCFEQALEYVLEQYSDSNPYMFFQNNQVWKQMGGTMFYMNTKKDRVICPVFKSNYMYANKDPKIGDLRYLKRTYPFSYTLVKECIHSDKGKKYYFSENGVNYDSNGDSLPHCVDIYSHDSIPYKVLWRDNCIYIGQIAFPYLYTSDNMDVYGHITRNVYYGIERGGGKYAQWKMYDGEAGGVIYYGEYGTPIRSQLLNNHVNYDTWHSADKNTLGHKRECIERVKRIAACSEKIRLEPYKKTAPFPEKTHDLEIWGVWGDSISDYGMAYMYDNELYSERGELIGHKMECPNDGKNTWGFKNNEKYFLKSNGCFFYINGSEIKSILVKDSKGQSFLAVKDWFNPFIKKQRESYWASEKDFSDVQFKNLLENFLSQFDTRYLNEKKLINNLINNVIDKDTQIIVHEGKTYNVRQTFHGDVVTRENEGEIMSFSMCDNRVHYIKDNAEKLYWGYFSHQNPTNELEREISILLERLLGVE